MADIAEVRAAVIDFVKETLKANDANVIKVTKAESGWETESEVYEQSSFIKALGLSTRVQDKNIYKVELDDNLQVQSYGRKEAAGEDS